jgi:hypothetical protein
MATAAAVQIKVDAQEVLAALRAMSRAAWELAWYQATGVPWEKMTGGPRLAALDVTMVPGLPPATRIRIRGTALELPASRLEVVQTPNDRQTVLRIDVPIYRDTVSIATVDGR